jgi:hypothetical protein
MTRAQMDYARAEILKRIPMKDDELERQVAPLIAQRIFQDDINALISRGEVRITARGEYYLTARGKRSK